MPPLRWGGVSCVAREFPAGGRVMEQLERVTLAVAGTARRETILIGPGRLRGVRVGRDGFIDGALPPRSCDHAGRLVRLRPPGP